MDIFKYDIIDKIVYIKLTQDFETKVNLSDYLKYKLYNYKWFSQKYGNFNYAQSWCKKNKKRVKLHKLINPSAKVVDHKNGVTLDNRRKNLRSCTLKQNARNAKKPKHGITSIYKGVSKQSKNSYRARIRVNGKAIHLGSGSELHCAELYNIAAIKYFGEFARLNEID